MYKLALVPFMLGLFHLHASAQWEALSIDELIAGNNSILLYDAQSIDRPAFSGAVPSNPEMELLGDRIAVNWTLHNILSTKCKLTLQLFTNEDIPQPSPVRTIQYIKIRVKFLKTNGDLDSLEEDVRLQTGYDNSANSAYVFYHSFKQDSAVLAFIQVDSIVFEGRSYPPIGFSHGIPSPEPIGVINSIPPFKLVARLDPVHVYGLTSAIPSNGLSVSDCKVSCSYIDATGNIQVDWSDASNPDAVTYTELAWTFISTYPSGPSHPNTPYDFRMNNTSVQISATDHYSLPMIFEKGILIFRFRWVSVRGEDRKPVYSNWSLPESGIIGDVVCGKFEVTNDLIHEADKKNWQYISTYAEEGKHKAVVTYYDGTMRNRQAVTRLSESNDSKTVIVGETIYDFQGRPAIQVLPVPVGMMDFPVTGSTPHTGIDVAPAPSLHMSWQTARETILLENLGLLGYGSSTSTTSTTSIDAIPDAPGQYLPQKIQYYPDFNLNDAGVPYSWIDFDKGSLCDPTVQAASMSSSKGASRYYSGNNDDQSGFNANIPDAHGYPFSQTEYTPDPTGRISRQGAVGETFQLRRGHDTRYYYGAPSQDELDRLFGSDAGLASYYKKNMIRDGNGQTAVEYVDMKGKVVASGLAGDVPDNLEPLENTWTFQNTKDLLDADVRLENELHNTLRSTTRLLIEQNQTLVSFEYELRDTDFKKELCPGTTFCLDCIYDYSIEVVDECGHILWSDSQMRIGASGLNAICDFDTSILQAPDPILLNAGVYTVTRTLSVSPSSIESYGELYDTTAICPRTRDSLRLVGQLNFPMRGCNLTCENCALETYAGRHAGDTVMNTVNGISMPYIITQSDIDRDSLYCFNLCHLSSSTLDNVLQMMLDDVSKNGMYGEIYQHIPDNPSTPDRNEERDIMTPIAFPLSVFNASNQLGTDRNWRYPSQNRFNPGGTNYYERDSTGALTVESWVTILPHRVIAYRDPANMEVYAIAAGKWRMEDGKLQIKPEALRDVDFIEAWKAEWAYALLPYHPEYPTLLWYIRNTASNDYDEKLNSIQTYAEAEAFIHGLTDINQSNPPILDEDPYFSDDHFSERISARTQIKAQLFSEPDAFGHRPLESKALSCAYCAIENISPAELTACLGTRHLYENPEMRDSEWGFVRALYIQQKHHIQDSLRVLESVLHNPDARYTNGFTRTILYSDPSSLNIGDSSTRVSNPYRNKIMRFPTQNDIMKNMVGCPQVSRTSGGSTFIVPDITCMREKAEAMLGNECNKCPLAQELETVLWFLASTHKLTSEDTDGMIGRIISTSDMITPLGSSHVRRMTWSPVITGDELMIHIRVQDNFSGPGATYSQFIKLKSFDAGIQWDNIRVIRCLNYTASPVLLSFSDGKNFTLRGIDESGREFRMEGMSSCFVLDSCKYFQPVRGSNGEHKENKVGNSNSLNANANTPAEISTENSTCCPPMPPSLPLPENDCERNRQNLIAFFYHQHLKEKVAQGRIQLRNEYTDACLRHADTFKATMDNSIYQLTLYYYDQAGNLVKTVPPAGVDTLNRDEIRTVQNNRISNINVILSPDHRLVSSYRYNTLNQVVEKITPDAGLVQLFYDSLGRVHLSQDAVQANLTSSAGAERPYHYILFDKLGRISESGQAYLDPTRVRTGSGSHTAVRNMVNAARRKDEVVQIYYDRPANNTINNYFLNGGQQLLRNRVSSTVFTEAVNNDHSTILAGADGIVRYTNATHYSYDYHGNVKTLIQENRDQILMDLGQSRKRIDYDYDLISGKTNKVCYQCDSTDQFIHRYEYDADNRITNTYTGTRSDRLQRDAEYIFYKHGSLARINLGDRFVQGIDYAYTLQGWLKGINSNAANAETDMGGDGGTGSPYAGDRYGFSLNYFTNDYTPIVTRDAGHRFLAGTGDALASHLAERSLYNGNISSTAATINDITGPGTLLHLYAYDQLHRIKTSNSYACLNPGTNAWGSRGDPVYQTNYSYDPNGNITHLTRSARGIQYDNLTYSYPGVVNQIQNNKLQSVTDSASPRSLNGAGDISARIDYVYDQNGNITGENGAILRWTSSGRIKQYGADQHYAYNDAQLRIKKSDANSTQFYVYDPTGNILAFYTFRNNQLIWSGSPIYGTSRLGMYHANKVLPSIGDNNLDTLWRGKTEYELTNHLGDVLATITDKKLTRTEGSSAYSSDLSTAQEYLPFGMSMPNRRYPSAEGEHAASSSDAYPFAYNGMERDKKDGADGYTTEFRQYDSRIGRWKSMDPKTEKTNSYYDGLGNNPIALTDIKGDEDHPPQQEDRSGNSIDIEDYVSSRGSRVPERIIRNIIRYERDRQIDLREFAGRMLTNIEHELAQRHPEERTQVLMNQRTYLQQEINGLRNLDEVQRRFSETPSPSSQLLHYNRSVGAIMSHARSVINAINEVNRPSLSISIAPTSVSTSNPASNPTTPLNHPLHRFHRWEPAYLRLDDNPPSTPLPLNHPLHRFHRWEPTYLRLDDNPPTPVPGPMPTKDPNWRPAPALTTPNAQ